MIQMVYVHRFPEDWPSKTDTDQPKSPVLRIFGVKLKRVGTGEELDPNGPDAEVTEEGELYLEVELQYGCKHTKFPNVARWGQWYCGEMNCPHYLGRKEAAE